MFRRCISVDSEIRVWPRISTAFRESRQPPTHTLTNVETRMRAYIWSLERLILQYFDDMCQLRYVSETWPGAIDPLTQSYMSGEQHLKFSKSRDYYSSSSNGSCVAGNVRRGMCCMWQMRARFDRLPSSRSPNARRALGFGEDGGEGRTRRCSDCEPRALHDGPLRLRAVAVGRARVCTAP